MLSPEKGVDTLSSQHSGRDSTKNMSFFVFLCGNMCRTRLHCADGQNRSGGEDEGGIDFLKVLQKSSKSFNRGSGWIKLNSNMKIPIKADDDRKEDLMGEAAGWKLLHWASKVRERQLHLILSCLQNFALTN